jgi:sugar transferase (PEP-CTERM/EpsH1 system associated)
MAGTLEQPVTASEAAGPLRVIHVIRACQTGGLETLVLDASARMQREGAVNVSVCALLPGDGLELRPQYASVSCRTATERERRSTVAVVRALAGIFRQERPDVVHTHNFLCQVRAGLAAKLAHVPVVVSTKHGREWPRVFGSLRLAARFYRLADALVAVSQDVRDGFLSTYRFPPERMRLILNGTDTDRFRPLDGDREEPRHRLLGITGQPLLGTVCRLVEMKGIRPLLDAVSRIRERLPGVALAIVGDGPARAAFEAHARRLGVNEHVRFLGNRSDMEAVYPLFDIFVLPSYSEGISLTLLEAGSCALPVIATAVGGNPEIITDGVTGRLVPPRNAEALAEAVLAYWQAMDAARSMGRAARQSICERFSLDRMAREYVGLYSELCARKACR